MMRIDRTLLTVFCLLPLAGCPVADAPLPPPMSESEASEPIHALVERTLRANLAERQLSTQIHGGWQILHGILAYGKDFTVQTPVGQRPAVQYLLEGGEVAGFEPMLGDPFDGEMRRGLRMPLQPTTKVGQGHRDQWLAVLVQSGLEPDTEVQVDGQRLTMLDWVQQVEYDMPLNFELEFSWTLIGLLAYRDTDHRWLARDGNEYSIELLVDSETQQNLATSTCGGTHRLIGLAMALNKRRLEGRPIVGPWIRAQTLVEESIEAAKQNQNPDGSYSVDYLHRTGWTRDLGEALGTTGHVLEFLAIAAPDETLRQPWVQRSVRRICQILHECRDVDLECGVLYHALHGLSEYQRRTAG